MIVSSALVRPFAHASEAAGDAEARFNAGLTHLREGRVELALDDDQEGVSQDDKNALLLQGAGHGLRASGSGSDAIEAYRKALRAQPLLLDVRNDLGMALILSGKRDEGSKEFLTVFSDPTNPTPEMTARNLGQSYLEEKNYAGGPQLVPLVHHPQQDLRRPVPRRGRRAHRDRASSTRRSRQLEAAQREMPDDPAMLNRPSARST